jgi:hypothetical protein
MSELLPCPFCGSEVYITHVFLSAEDINCYKCGIVMRADTTKNVSAYWNTRVANKDVQFNVLKAAVRSYVQRMDYTGGFQLQKNLINLEIILREVSDD